MATYKYYAPTEVVFGKDAENQVGALVKKWGGSRVLVHYGGQSAIKSGLLDRVVKSLEEQNLSVVLLGGVVPNPRLSKVREGISLGRSQKIDFILAVGGGSVIDSSKAIGYGLANSGDVWDFYAKNRMPQSCIPLGAVLTIAAAGSEMSNSSVITNEEGWLKRGCSSDLGRCKFAVMNPELTYSLPHYQTASGCTDIMMHTLERYFTNEERMDITDELAEGLLRSVIRNARILKDNPRDYTARANIMWAAQQALFGIADTGKGHGERVEHKMEHILSAKYNCAHGAGLAVVVPPYRKLMCARKPKKYRQFSENVFHIDTADLNDYDAGMKGIEALEVFIKSVGLPTTLREIGAKSEADIDFLAEELVKQGRIAEGTGIGLKELKAMYTAAY